MEKKEPVVATEYPIIGAIYKHFKGGTYEVITLANHTETEEILVIYRSLLFGSIYARPLSSWFEKVQVLPSSGKNVLPYSTTRFIQIENRG
jgi:hypothetical protein